MSFGGELSGRYESNLALGEETAGPGATSVEAIKSDLKKVAVAYQNSVVKIFDIQTGKELAKLNSDISYGKLVLLLYPVTN